MNFFAITWDPSLGIDLGFFTIRWYSLMFVAAFIFGLRIMKKIYIEDKISIEKIDTLFMYTFISMLVGMRLGEVFFTVGITIKIIFLKFSYLLKEQ